MIPRVSVIVPVYNVEAYLEECVGSIRKQTLREIEIILVDDGSTDNCPKMCDQYAREDERIRVVHQKNAGASAARNVGLRIARGEYISFVDSDDWADSDYLDIMLKYMVPGGMVACNFVRERDFEAKNVRLADRRGEYEITAFDRTEAQASVMRHEDGKNIHAVPYCKLYDRRLLEEHQIIFCKDIIYAEDELFIIQYLSCIKTRVIWIKATAYHYRYRPYSIMYIKLQPHLRFDRKLLSEVVAVKREISYIEHTQEMMRCYAARLVTAEKNVFAIMGGHQRELRAYYRKYLRDIRKKLFIYLRYGDDPTIERIATVLCAVHPGLYYQCLKVWRCICDHRRRR